MKRILSILSVLLFILLLATPALARDKSELNQVYTDLSRYFYTPYFTDSQYFSNYENEMKNTGLLLSRSDLTDSEISLQYDALKQAFTTLMRDTFDYSTVDQLKTDFESLDLTLFEEDGWSKLSTVMEEVYDEISAPTLFKKGASTKESYSKEIQNHLSKFKNNFRTAFNNLKLKPISEHITPEQLGSLVNYCRLSATKNLMGDSTYWIMFNRACEQANALAADNASLPAMRYEAARSLLSAYQSVSKDCFDLSPITDITSTFQSQNQNQYTEESWNRYKNEIESLNTLLNTPQFLYLNNLSESEDPNKLIQSFFEQKSKSAKASYEQLVAQKDINKLSVLCNTYHNTTASTGLDLKLKALLDSVDAGYQILKNKDASSQEINQAILAIENAAQDLQLAETYLKTETNQNLKNDVKTIQMIIIFASVTLILSLVFACILTYRKFGRLIWYQ